MSADVVLADTAEFVEPAFTPGGKSDSMACGSGSVVAGCSIVGCGSWLAAGVSEGDCGTDPVAWDPVDEEVMFLSGVSDAGESGT